jgi:hypothetical protein
MRESGRASDPPLRDRSDHLVHAGNALTDQRRDQPHPVQVSLPLRCLTAPRRAVRAAHVTSKCRARAPRVGVDQGRVPPMVRSRRGFRARRVQ